MVFFPKVNTVPPDDFELPEDYEPRNAGAQGSVTSADPDDELVLDDEPSLDVTAPLATGNDGRIYEPGGASNPVNQELYKTQGQPLAGQSWLPRTMSKLDDKGNKTTEFVMPPSGAATAEGPITGNEAIDKPLRGAVDVARGTTRAAAYAASNVAKHTLGFGEWLFDLAQQPDAEVNGVSINVAKHLGRLGDYLLNTKEFTDTDKNFFDQNFPTTPVANEGEKLVGDMAAIMIGGQAGKNIGETIIKQFWNKARKIDATSAMAKAQAFAKAVGVTIPSEAAGASIVTPSNMEPITGNHFLDNLAMTYGLSAIGKAIGGAARFANDKVLGGFRNKATPNNSMRAFMEHIDPVLNEVAGKIPDDEVAARARILGEIANKNSSFETGLSNVENSTLQLDTTTAMAMNDAAKEYYERAYDFLKPDMSPEQWQAFVDNNAQRLIENLRGVKKSRVLRGSDVVEAKDADLYKQTESLFTESADNMALEGDVMGQMESAVQAPMDELAGAKTDLVTAKNRQIIAKDALDQEYNDNALTKALEDFRRQDFLGTNEASRAEFRSMSMDGLVKAWKADKAEVDAAYKAIPREPYDYGELADSIIAAGQEDTALAALKVKPGGSTVERIVGEGADEVEAAADLATKRAELVNSLRERFPDINSLWNEGRSVLSRRISNAYDANAGGATLDVSQTEAVREAIDDIVGKSTNQQVIDAQNRYKQFANTWLVNQQLKSFDEAMSKTRTIDGVEVGIDDAKAVAYETFQSAITDPTKLQMPRVLEAIKDPTASSTAQEYMLGESLSNLVMGMKAGEPLSTAQYIKELTPLVQYMDEGGSLRANFEATLKVLNDAEQGLVSAEKAVAQAMDTATQIKAKASENAAVKYFTKDLDQITNPESTTVASFTSNPRAAFNELFKSKEAADEIPRLIKEVEAVDPIAAEGVRSQYLRYIRDEYFTSRAVGVDTATGTPDFARNPSAGKLHKTLNTSRDNVVNTINAVLAPEDAKAVTTILDLLDKKVNLDTAKAFTGGSDTVKNAATAQQSTYLITRMVFGPLNHKATLINSITGLWTAGWQQGNDKIAQQMLDLFITDPHFLSKTAALMKNGADDGAIINGLKAIKNAAGPLGYAYVGAKKPPVDQETENMLNDERANLTDQQLAESSIGPMLDAFSEVPMKWRGREQSANIEDRRPKNGENPLEARRREYLQNDKTYKLPFPEDDSTMSDEEAAVFMKKRSAPKPMPRLKDR